MAERYMELLPFVHMSAWLGLFMVRGAGGVWTGNHLLNVGVPADRRLARPPERVSR